MQLARIAKGKEVRMAIKEVKIVKAWMERSEADLKTADGALEKKVYADVVYHCEQAVQKAIRAVLVLFEIREIAEHRVASLFDDRVVSQYPELEKLAKIAYEIERHWLKSRYPLLTKRGIFNPLKFYKRKFAKKCLNNAKFFVKRMKKFLKENFNLSV